VLPSFGYHPWYVHERTRDWANRLAHFLDAVPSAVGEIGLDRWKAGLPYASQEEVFQAQLRLAAERNLPVSIHCLRAWGRLFELLRANPRPACGFLLHSYGGPREMVKDLAGLGACFGFPGYFLHERKARQRETFRHVPLDRLLVETDAPDQAPPDPGLRSSGAAHSSFCRLSDPANNRPINHPANLAFIYNGLANALGVGLDRLAAQMEENFARLFGHL
jgi:TatD DNase family protein